MSSEIFDLDLSEDFISEELKIDYSSVFAIERELAEHSIKESRYVRYAAIANKEVARLELKKKVTIAEIVDEEKKKAIQNKKPIPPSAVGELRKSSVPLYKRYQEVCKDLADTYEVAEILNGLVRSWNSRGFRLNMIAKLNDDDKYTFSPEIGNINEKLEH